MIIRRITALEIDQAMALALEVFMQFEAPDYGPEGVASFKRDIVENPVYLDNVKAGNCPIYGAFDKGTLVAIIGMRSNRTHINLVFTKKEYHRQGVARAVFQYLLEDIKKEFPQTKELTLNSSPYGLPFYLRMGFVPTGKEQTINGIRFTPMKFIIPT